MTHTQISRCYWCDKKVELEFDRTPESWQLVPDWYQVSGPMAGEFCRWGCFLAWVLSHV